jgi:hypothetical protein
LQRFGRREEDGLRPTPVCGVDFSAMSIFKPVPGGLKHFSLPLPF